MNEYAALVKKVNSTGNIYDINLEVKIVDDNPSRLTTTADAYLSGEKQYYSVYSNEILAILETKEEYDLKPDDFIIVTVENVNITVGAQFRGFVYKLFGKDSGNIVAKASATIV